MKVVYYVHSLAHKRVLESFSDVDGMEQTIVAPKPIITSNVIPEDYRDFKIKNIVTYSNNNDANRLIQKISPDVVAQTTTGNIVNIPGGSKKVYISHGMIGNHVKAMSKRGTAKTWHGFNLYCGSTPIFKEWIEHATGNKQNILLNSFPQFDLLYDDYVKEYKDDVINTTRNNSPAKTILFCGFCCKDRADFKLHSEDYFSTAVELERISRKHNFLIFMKPRHSFSRTVEFLKQNARRWSWTPSQVQSYVDIKNSKHIHFITTNSHIYRYYFADLVVCNGCSTAEIEACILNRPLVLTRTKVKKEEYDPFSTVSSGAGVQVSDINNLEGVVLDSFNGDSHIIKQNELLKSNNIVVDGKAHKRIQRGIMSL
jgi:hypothetical protein